ncbi:MAG: hypothetical protein ABR601_03505 [Parasphingopyxis sp.]|nr:hypothetical protein [Sphingomonadales bacterium]
MIALLALALQSAGPAASVPHSHACTESPGSEEIVVCARGPDADHYRIPEELRDSRDEESSVPRARIGIVDGMAAEVRGEQADVGGFPSQRVFVTLSTVF